MKLSDIMSAANLAGFAEAGLALFFLAFMLVALQVFWPGQTAEYEKLRRLPLAETQPDPDAPSQDT